MHHRDHCADGASTDFEALFPSARTLLRDDLDPEFDAALFQPWLWSMFTVSYPHTLTLPQRDRVRWHLFPEVRLATQTSLAFEDAAAPPALPDLVTVINLQQEQVARTLGEGHRVIPGAACSGKTMILIFRVQFLAAAAAAARPDPPILVLCFNRTLSSRISALLRQRGVALPCRTRARMRAFKAALRRAQILLQSMNAQACKRFDWQHKSVKPLTAAQRQAARISVGLHRRLASHADARRSAG